MKASTLTVLLALSAACSGRESQGGAASASSRTGDSIPSAADTAPRSQGNALDSLLAFAQSQPRCATPATDSLPQAIHLEATPSSEIEPAFFCFATTRATYAIAATGSAFRLVDGRSRELFRVRTDTGFFVERVMYRDVPEALYIYYQTSAAGDGMGYLDRFAQRDLRFAWPTAATVSINLGPALVQSDSLAYVSGLDVVGKLDLRTGSYYWKHILFNEDLEAAGVQHFTAFLLAERRGDMVLFPPWPPDAAWHDTLVVDDRTGLIVAPGPLSGHEPVCPRKREFC